MSVSSAKITPIFERWFNFETWVFLICVQSFSDFSVRSTSEFCMLFICVVFVSILLTYCSLRFSVSPSFIVISACSSLSTSFLKSKPGSRIEEGCDALFLIAIFLN